MPIKKGRTRTKPKRGGQYTIMPVKPRGPKPKGPKSARKPKGKPKRPKVGGGRMRILPIKQFV